MSIYLPANTMYRTIGIILTCLTFIQFLGAQEQIPHFLTYPTLTPDGSQAIFCFEGDLWQVSTEGGTAYRLTAMEGEEVRPRVSPDGKWLAFSASPDGQMDVYLMPLGGGTIKRLTWHEGFDEVESWSWDSEHIYTCSNRNNRFSSYKISREGGTPSRLFHHYFHTTHNLFPHPDGRLFFNESWESKYFISRKGYKGAFNPDIKSYDPATEVYTYYTDFEGKDMEATIDQEGTVYYTSTEYNGEYNLYKLDKDKRIRLTTFDESIRHPFVCANGTKVIFEKDYQLHIWDAATETTQQITVKIPTFKKLSLEKDFEVAGEITYFDVSPDDKKFVWVSRGKLFVSDTEGKFIQQIATLPQGRVSEALWLNDNKRILFSQTVNGYQNWFVISADTGTVARSVTSDEQNNRNLTFNSDRTQAVYLSGRNEVRLLDLETFVSQTIVNDEIWALYNPNPYFSPDDQYIMYTAYRNFEQDIFLYHLTDKTTINLTQTALTETTPFWSPDGKYVYFTADRNQPNYPYGPEDPNLYRIPLLKYDEPFKAEKYSELFADTDEAKGETSEEDQNDDSSSGSSDSVVVKIDTTTLLLRWEQIGPQFGSQSGPYVVQKEDKTWIFFISDHDEGKSALWQLTMKDFEDKKTEKVDGLPPGNTQLRVKDDKGYVLADGAIYKLNIENGKAEKITINHTFRSVLQAEFEQMFEEVWANVEENFYNEDFHGIDWKGMRDKYAAYLPFLNSRNDLRRLITDMLGELNTSHYGFSSLGEEEKTFYKAKTMTTGILFQDNEPYIVDRVVEGSSADKAHIDIQQGDVLEAVNGQLVDPVQNRESYFSNPSQDEELHLTLSRNGTRYDISLHPQSYQAVENLRYNEWEQNCQKLVDSLSSHRIAYVHMKNMGRGELDRFYIDMTSEAHRREGTILDLRYNTGGNVHDEVLRFLAQKPYLKWKYREGAYTSQSNFGPSAKPIVLLINEQSLSDAEMTAAGFKQLNLGTILGTETYRWIIFTTGKTLVDGSFYRLPSWGCYTLDDANLEKTGVAPDINIENTFLHRLKGEDPQLEEAVTIIMNQLDK